MKVRILSLILVTVFASAAGAQKIEQSRPPIIDVEEQKRDIFYKNAVRFFRLDKK